MKIKNQSLLKRGSVIKLICVSAFIAMISSCIQDTALDTTETQVHSRFIGFSPVSNPRTRASAMITDSMRTFQVWAVHNGGVLPNLNGATVSRPGVDAPWRYSPMQEWPSGGAVDFYAISPAGTGITPSELTSGNNVRFNYEVPVAANQIDLLVSRKLSEPSGERTAPVNLKFEHALSRVMLQVSSSVSGVAYKIHEVSLVNLYNEGKYDFANGWSPSGYADKEVLADLSGSIWDGDSVSLMNGTWVNVLGPQGNIDNALMVLPQATSSGDQQVYDDAGAYTGTGTVLKVRASCLGETTKTKTFYLPIDTLRAGTASTFDPIEFREGYQYTLKLRFHPGAMFDKYFVEFQGVEVSEWTTNAHSLGYEDLSYVPIETVCNLQDFHVTTVDDAIRVATAMIWAWDDCYSRYSSLSASELQTWNYVRDNYLAALTTNGTFDSNSNKWEWPASSGSVRLIIPDYDVYNRFRLSGVGAITMELTARIRDDWQLWVAPMGWMEIIENRLE